MTRRAMQKSQTPRQRTKIDQIPYTTGTFIISRPTREYTHTGSTSSLLSSIPLLAYKCYTAGRLIHGLAVCRANWLRKRVLLKGAFIVCEDWPSHASFHNFTQLLEQKSSASRSPCVSTASINSFHTCAE